MMAQDPEQLPIDLAVVGENKEDPDRLLLLGEDGHYYSYSLPDDAAVPVEPGDDWQIENADPDALFT